jgi:hypothetical protein
METSVAENESDDPDQIQLSSGQGWHNFSAIEDIAAEDRAIIPFQGNPP